MKLTHDAQAALERLGEAALEMNEYTTPGTMAWSCFAEAAKAYRATQVKECRPPDGAKNCRYWNLTDRDGVHFIALWQSNKWDFTGDTKGREPSDPTLHGWTVHSECRFGETGVEATDEELYKFWKDWPREQALPSRPDDPPSEGEYAVAYLRDALNRFILTHFRAPKLEISDEEIGDLAYIHCTQSDVPGCERFNFQGSAIYAFVRAVIAKVGGEK